MATSGSKSSANSTTMADKSMGVDDLIGKLNLQEREEDDLNFDEEFPDETGEAEFMAIAKVHTDKPFSRGAFYESMRMAWSLARGATFSALGENLFSITVNCLGDWKRITEEGPWLFRDHGVLIESYNGFTKLDEVALDKLAVWIQIVDLPPMYSKEQVVRSLTRKVGEVMSVMLNPRWGNGRIARVRVRLDVNEPLMRAESGKPSVKELQDDASSPLKAGDGNKHEGEKSRKRLTYEEPATEPSSSKLPLLLEAAAVGIIPMENLGPNPGADGEEEDDVSSQDSKRSKMGCNTVMDGNEAV
ncbi:hypothetical protein D1007_01112 [Hordeum vulgare]|nr:hypothetical protein D1007_01112 [Hordeum vulgare]